MKITMNQLRRIIKEEVAAVAGRGAGRGSMVYVVAVMEIDGEIEKRVYTLDPADKNRAARPDQFCADAAARLGGVLLDVIVTDEPADSSSASAIAAKYGNEWEPGDEPNPRLAKVSPVSGGWNPESAPKASDRGY